MVISHDAVNYHTVVFWPHYPEIIILMIILGSKALFLWLFTCYQWQVNTNSLKYFINKNLQSRFSRKKCVRWLKYTTDKWVKYLPWLDKIKVRSGFSCTGVLFLNQFAGNANQLTYSKRWLQRWPDDKEEIWFSDALRMSQCENVKTWQKLSYSKSMLWLTT